MRRRVRRRRRRRRKRKRRGGEGKEKGQGRTNEGKRTAVRNRGEEEEVSDLLLQTSHNSTHLE